MDTDELSSFFATLVASGFKHCTRIPTTGNAAKILSTTMPDGRPIVVKVFQDRPEDGVKARDLFELELLAQESLKSTGRVAEVIFRWHGNDGQYFIVKPYYEKFLDRERNMLTPLELLEFAAQEVDISEKFFARGWRDLDGRYSNDAIDQTGRLVRVDLDGAYVNWAISPKFVPEHHTRRDQEHCSALFGANRKVFSRDSEIRSLTIRISRLLLRNDETPWNLLDQVIALNDHKLHSFKDSFRTVRKAAGRVLQPQKKRTVREKWVSAWEETLSRRVPLQGSLTGLEAKFLALLFFHILTRDDHQFLLPDLYHSLMILAVNSLQVSNRTLAQSNKANRKQTEQQFTNLVQSLYEVTRLREVVEDRRKAEVAQSVVAIPPAPTTPAESFMVESRYDGAFWPAITKGPEWKSQDIVLASLNEPYSTFLLADGASGAGGDRAIELLQDVYQEWRQNIAARTLKEAENEICDLIRLIHDRLTQYRKRENRKIETAVVAVSVFNMTARPSVLFVRYGDTGYLVTHEGSDGNLRSVLGTKAEEKMSPPLGSRDNWRLNPFEELKVLKLQWEGMYRIRAFSDGIGTEEHAWELLGGKASIHDLVSEARSWSTYPQVGGDDWSIAGFDLTVQRSTDPVEEIMPERSDESTSPLESLDRIDATNFPLSQGALEFWKRTIAPLDGQSKPSQSTLIRTLLQKTPDPILGKTAPVPLDNRSQGGDSHLFRYAVYALLGVGLVVLVWFGARWLLGKSQETPAKVGTATPAPQSREPQMVNQQQRDLYGRLKAGQIYVVTGLPSGYQTNESLFKTLISDLAHVLRQTDWNVTVEVHTDTTGTAQQNLIYSGRRRDEIKTQLVTVERIAPTRVEVVSLGESRPVVLGENAQSNQLNRRLEIYRVR